MPTEDAMRAPDMETNRLPYDDGRSGHCRVAARKTLPGRWVASLAIAVLDTRLHMRQEDRGGAWN